MTLLQFGYGRSVTGSQSHQSNLAKTLPKGREPWQSAEAVG